jgi:hypothetical protein
VTSTDTTGPGTVLWQSELGATADHRAATSAFVNREKPVFQGR